MLFELFYLKLKLLLSFEDDKVLQKYNQIQLFTL